MRNSELTQQVDRLRALLDRAATMTDDLELLGHWGRYLCVLVAGFLESALREIYTDRARRVSSPDVASFVATALKRVENPKASRFVEIASRFSKGWGDDLDGYLSEDNGHRRNAIDSIMANRNLIAHGRSADISVVRVRDYLKAIVQVVEFIEGQCA